MTGKTPATKTLDLSISVGDRISIDCLPPVEITAITNTGLVRYDVNGVSDSIGRAKLMQSLEKADSVEVIK